MVTLPSEICQAYEIRRGDHLLFQAGNDGSIIVFKIDLSKRPDLKIFTEEGLDDIS